MSLIKDEIKEVKITKYVTILGDMFDTKEQAEEFLVKKYLTQILAIALDAEPDDGVTCEIPDIVDIIMDSKDKILDLLIQ